MNNDANEERKKYYRKWREQNKERVKKYNEKYWMKKAKEAENDHNRTNRNDS